MTKVTLPSGLIVQHHGLAPYDLAELCPRREEHTPTGDRRRYAATVHEPCGLEVVWVSKRTGLRRG